MPRVEIVAKGFEGIQYYVGRVPSLPRAAIEKILEDLASLGMEEMARSLTERLKSPDKATGRIAASLQKGTAKISANEWLVRVGSNLDAAFYATRDISQSLINRPVKLDTLGKWVFVGMRPPIPKHPFLDDTAAAWERELPRYFGESLVEEAKKLEAEARSFKGKEAATEAAMRSLFE